MQEVNDLIATLPQITHENADMVLPQIIKMLPSIPPKWLEGMVNTHVKRLLCDSIGQA